MVIVVFVPVVEVIVAVVLFGVTVDVTDVANAAGICARCDATCHRLDSQVTRLVRGPHPMVPKASSSLVQ